MSRAESDEARAVSARTEKWVTEFVIGLNLCPFAKAVQVKGQVRYVVSPAETTDALLADLARVALELHAAPPERVDTALLIHPHVLTDFLDYNDFVAAGEDLLADLGLEGELQLAGFHPHYCFADSPADDAANYTNRSPYPMLHLLREASVSRAVDTFPDTNLIYERNIETLRGLSPRALAALVADEGRDE